MPNWVNNTMRVIGEEAELKRFKEAVKSEKEPLSFEKIVSSKESRESLKPKWAELDNKERERWFCCGDRTEEEAFDSFWFNYEGYEWNCANWGTKWELQGVDIEETNGELVYYFNTAWNEPEAIFHKVAKQFPALHFDIFCEYDTGELDIYYTFSEGKLIDFQENTFEFSTCPECEGSAIRGEGEEFFVCEDCGHEFRGGE